MALITRVYTDHGPIGEAVNGEGGAAIDGFRNLPRPLVGRARIAAFVATATRRSGGRLRGEERQLNGRPAVVFFRGDAPFAALLLAVADGHRSRADGAGNEALSSLPLAVIGSALR